MKESDRNSQPILIIYIFEVDFAYYVQCLIVLEFFSLSILTGFSTLFIVGDDHVGKTPKEMT